MTTLLLSKGQERLGREREAGLSDQAHRNPRNAEVYGNQR